MEIIVYIKVGFLHITDLGGYDHILFIMSLCAVYQWRDWRKVLLLVTAFTIGHSITLALATLNILNFPKSFIEFLIPVTIVCTAVGNVFSPVRENHEKQGRDSSNWRYIFAVCFGLIHGLGFSNFLRAMLMKSSIVVPLLGFNIGLELGQILVVIITLSIASLLVSILNLGLKMRDWCNFISGAAAGIGLILLLNSEFWNKNILGKNDKENVAQSIYTNSRQE
jgi:HupE / UreJ protein